MIRTIRRLLRQTEGAMLAYVALILPIFFGFMALGLDVAAWHIEKRQNQTMADAAVMAAAFTAARLRAEEESESVIEDEAEAEALEIVIRNGFNAAAGDEFEFNFPPASGAYVGNPDALEVIVRTPLPLFLSALLDDSTKFGSSRAVAAVPGDTSPVCLLALSPDAPYAFESDSNARVNADGCSIQVNSEDTIAFSSDGNSVVTADIICVGGGFEIMSNAVVTPEPEIGCPPVADPLASLPQPEVGECDHTDTVHNEETVLLTPGVYCGGLEIANNTQAQMEPGTYIIQDGLLRLDSNSSLTGDGVTFFLTGPETTLNFNSNTEVELTAPSTGSLAGILFFQDRAYGEGDLHRFDSNTVAELSGAFYLPNADFESASNSTLGPADGCLQIIAQRIKFDSNSIIINLGADVDSCPASAAATVANVRLVE